VRFEQISHKFEKPIDADARDQKKIYTNMDYSNHLYERKIRGFTNFNKNTNRLQM
jgi:hypothetical protein